jgi:hypothetical protein
MIPNYYFFTLFSNVETAGVVCRETNKKKKKKVKSYRFFYLPTS